jgi:hypothetical protein
MRKPILATSLLAVLDRGICGRPNLCCPSVTDKRGAIQLAENRADTWVPVPAPVNPQPQADGAGRETSGFKAAPPSPDAGAKAMLPASAPEPIPPSPSSQPISAPVPGRFSRSQPMRLPPCRR